MTRRDDPGHLAVDAARHDGRAAEVGRHLAGLLRAAGVGLEARVAELHDVAGPGLVPRRAGQVPVHDVPAAGAEAEVDAGGVEDDVVADRDRTGQLGEDVGPALGGVHPLEAGPLLEDAA